jgi:hypothetical protein
MRNSRYAQRYLRYNKQYEKLALGPFLRVFRGWMYDIDWASLNEFNYQAVIANTFNTDDLYDAYEEVYTAIGLIHGRRVGRGINRSLKVFRFENFATIYEMGINAYLRTYGVSRIVTVKKTFFEYIIELIDNRIEEEMVLDDIARSIMQLVNRKDFYLWQAERIARTEATASANYAATQAGEVSGFVMVKQWISTQDKRTRRIPPDKGDHLDMDTIETELNGTFDVENSDGSLTTMRFPGDPTAPAWQVINCRCAVSVIAKRDQDGKLIRTQ